MCSRSNSGDGDNDNDDNNYKKNMPLSISTKIIKI